MATEVTVPPAMFSEKTQYTILLVENCGSIHKPNRPPCPEELTAGIPVIGLLTLPDEVTIRIVPPFSVIKKRPSGKLVIPQGAVNEDVITFA
ncbi:hypothetical protein D3C85_1448600 [compost metagenome]